MDAEKIQAWCRAMRPEFVSDLLEYIIHNMLLGADQKMYLLIRPFFQERGEPLGVLENSFLYEKGREEAERVIRGQEALAFRAKKVKGSTGSVEGRQKISAEVYLTLRKLHLRGEEFMAVTPEYATPDGEGAFREGFRDGFQISLTDTLAEWMFDIPDRINKSDPKP